MRSEGTAEFTGGAAGGTTTAGAAGGVGAITTGLGVDVWTSLLLYTQPPSMARSSGVTRTA